jgi:type IV secretory pathway VirB10-like protein
VDGPLTRADATAATDIVRPVTLAPVAARRPRRALLAAAGVFVGLVVVGVGARLVAPRASTDEPSSVPPSSTTTAAAPPAPPVPATAPVPAAEPVPSTAPVPPAPPAPPVVLSTAVVPAMPSSPSSSPSTVRPRVRPAPDPSAATVARLDAVVGAAPLEQLKVVRAVCGQDACAGVNLLDEQTPARIGRCLQDCKDTVRRRAGR